MDMAVSGDLLLSCGLDKHVTVTDFCKREVMYSLQLDAAAISCCFGRHENEVYVGLASMFVAHCAVDGCELNCSANLKTALMGTITRQIRAVRCVTVNDQ